MLGSLPERYDDAAFERVLAGLPADLLARPTAQGTLEQLRRTNAASYATTFPADVPLERRVLWPTTPAESNGMEDARFVRFTDDRRRVDVPGHLHRVRRAARRRPHARAATTCAGTG